MVDYWRMFLDFHVPFAPPVYNRHERALFLTDVAVWLAASAENSGRGSKDPTIKVHSSQDGQFVRWPGLLVTDRWRLVKIATDLALQQSLACASRMMVSDLLPVVLSSDFGILSGAVVEALAVKTYRSPCCWEPPLVSKQDVPLGRTVDVGLGVFLQHHTSEEDHGKPMLFGARCLALFGDGRGAYSALSLDGTRCVEVYGEWQVINGHVVIGSSGTEAVHRRVSRYLSEVLENITYEEPVHIPIKELETDFEPPVDLSESIPRGGERLRLLLMSEEEHQELQIVDSPPRRQASSVGGKESPSRPQSALRGSGRPASAGRRCVSVADGKAPPLDRLDCTFASAWDTTFGSSVSPKAGAVDTAAGEPLRDTFMKTLVHALRSLSANETKSTPTTDRAPRLLGLDRGMTMRDSQDHIVRNIFGEIGDDASPSKADRPGLQGNKVETSAMKWLTSLAASQEMQCSHGTVQTHTSSPLGLGRYVCELGAPGKLGYMFFDLVLHVDGSCSYVENFQHSSLKSIPGAAFWKVGGGSLILSGRRPDTHGFHLQETRGNRSVQRQVMLVEMSIRVILQKCTYQPFQQQLEPFPAFAPRDASELVFGRVDPESPVFLGMRCQPDRLPYHAFEASLRRHGLLVDEILSDFVYLDRDADGQISLQNFVELTQYGSPSAAPEVLHELREALVQEYGTPGEAFEALQSASPNKQVTEAGFERFLSQRAPAEEDSEAGAKLKPLQDWVRKTTPEDRATVFASLNPNGNQDITLDDFMSIHVHSAILAVRRLEHFQSWLREEFGNTQEVFREVFRSLDHAQAGVLTRTAFVNGARVLGYPCEDKATGCMFSLLDRNFDGEITLRDFQKLRAFAGQEVLKELVALKNVVDEKLGGVDACFKKLQERERSVHHQSSMPKRISFDSFQKTMNHAGFSKSFPDADLKVLFLFITAASGKHANGFLTQGEWVLLQGLSSSAITGCPARLRKILEEEYGGMEQAFQRMHTSWMKRTLVKGLKQIALAAMVRALCAHSEGEGYEKHAERGVGPRRPRGRSEAGRPFSALRSAAGSQGFSAGPAGAAMRPGRQSRPQSTSTGTRSALPRCLPVV